MLKEVYHMDDYPTEIAKTSRKIKIESIVRLHPVLKEHWVKSGHEPNARAWSRKKQFHKTNEPRFAVGIITFEDIGIVLEVNKIRNNEALVKWSNGITGWIDIELLNILNDDAST